MRHPGVSSQRTSAVFGPEAVACRGCMHSARRRLGSSIACAFWPAPPNASIAATRMASSDCVPANAPGAKAINRSATKRDMPRCVQVACLKERATAPTTRGMSQDLLDRIDQRTRLAGHNRLALLLFRLASRQLFGVNVFKVQEVLLKPPLFKLPSLPPAFVGAADVRGRSVPVLDLARAINHPAPPDFDPTYLVVTEFNKSVQGFLVGGVDRIVNVAVGQIQPTPEMGGDCRYLTGVTRHQGELIQ